MSPRRYSPDRRRADAEETRRRIVEATVDLHSEFGVMATTYAMIAERADVAIPTVYNHFGTRGEIVAACTGHVAANAPPFGPQIFDGIVDVEMRLRALARALLARHRYLAPWMRWAVHEAPLIPELAAVLQKARPTLRQMIELALSPAFGSRPPVALTALCEILLDFPAWQRLSDEPGFTPEDLENLLGDALAVLVRQHRSASGIPARDRRKPRTKGNRK